ncbi:MAG: GntR family transcriptional regulator [Acetobacteraceae bacterium]
MHNANAPVPHPAPTLEAAGARAIRGAADGRVYSAIYEAIVDHRLPPGTALPEDTLSAAFGFSRTVIRKALQRLAHDHLVDQRPNRGACVARPSLEEARDVFAAREVVERATVAAAACAARPADLARLQRNLEAGAAALARGDRRAHIRLSGEFHLLIAEIGGNRALAGFVGQLAARSSLILALYEIPGRTPCAEEDHAALLGALAAHDEPRAQALMSAHLATLARDIGGTEEAPIDLHALFAQR